MEVMHVGVRGVSPSLVAYPQGGTTAQAMSFVVHLTIQERRRRAQLERSETLSTCLLLYFPERSVSFNSQGKPLTHVVVPWPIHAHSSAPVPTPFSSGYPHRS